VYLISTSQPSDGSLGGFLPHKGETMSCFYYPEIPSGARHEIIKMMARI